MYMTLLMDELMYIVRRFIIAMILVAGAIANVAVASEQSKELVMQGVDELKRQAYENALKKFDSAYEADKNDLQSLFFKAVVLNRTGHFDKSHAFLVVLKEKGFEHSEFNFEMGWSLMGIKFWQEALTAFESYENSRPGRGQTMEFIGRCHLALGEFEKARYAFIEALIRDPELKSTVDFYSALLERRLSNDEAAVKHLAAVLDSDSQLGRALREMTGVSSPTQTAEPDKHKNFDFAASAVIGYNDNAIGFAKAIPLPADITHKDSDFERFSANLSYRIQMTNSSVTAGYAFLADTYNDMPKVNLVDNYFYADYIRVFNDKLSGSVRVSDEYTLSGGDRYRNQIGLRPAFVYRFTGGSATEFSYGYAKSDYLFNNAVAAWNRDGHADTTGVTHYIILSAKSFVSASYSRTWNHSDGADFAFISDKVSTRVGSPLFKGVTGEVGFTYTKDSYDNPNTLSFNGVNRNDYAENFSAQIKKAVSKDINLFVQHSSTRAHSNIPFYSYNQNVWSVGVNVTR
jgi:tetratricopeptide (TPR) repeat protein